MTKKKWLIVVIAGGAFGPAGIGVLVVGLFVFQFVLPANRSLPVYTSQQTSSAHPGYRRSTVTSGASVYVQDFEEYSLRLAYPEPTNAIGRTAFGNGKICAIPGQSPTNYIAVDCRSEMPAYEVYRNTNSPPFDWRHATFQSMEFTGVLGTQSHKRTTDPSLIADLIRTLSDGTPVTPPLTILNNTNVSAVHLASGGLPGLIFCPQVHRDATGSFYVAASMAIEFTNRTEKIHAQWIPASPLFSQWLQTP